MPNKSMEWLAKTPVTIAALVFLPFTLPLVWLSPRFTPFWKVMITILTALSVYFLAKYSVMFADLLNQQLADMKAAGAI